MSQQAGVRIQYLHVGGAVDTVIADRDRYLLAFCAVEYQQANLACGGKRDCGGAANRRTPGESYIGSDVRRRRDEIVAAAGGGAVRCSHRDMSGACNRGRAPETC